MSKLAPKAAKKVIGQEVFYEHIGAIAVPAPHPRLSRYVVDLRQLSDRVAPRNRPQTRSVEPKPAPEPVKTSVPAPQPAPVAPAPAALATTPAPNPAVPAVTTPAAQSAPPKARPLYRRLAPHALRVAILLLSAAFFLSLGISLPERLIGIYLVATLVYAIDSQRTFLIALIFLVMVAVWSAFGNSVSAEQFAIYAFYFLVIGLISAIREMIFSRPQPGESAPSES
jgi:hypothetical protein